MLAEPLISSSYTLVLTLKSHSVKNMKNLPAVNKAAGKSGPPPPSQTNKVNKDPSGGFAGSLPDDAAPGWCHPSPHGWESEPGGLSAPTWVTLQRRGHVETSQDQPSIQGILDPLVCYQPPQTTVHTQRYCVCVAAHPKVINKEPQYILHLRLNINWGSLISFEASVKMFLKFHRGTK